MIKVIMDGKKVVFTAVCNRCGCVFEYDWCDVQQHITHETVCCPCCKKEVKHPCERGAEK